MSNEKKPTGFSTLAVHAGVEPDPSTGAIMTPVYMTSTYVQDGIGQQGYEYSRSSNPTRMPSRLPLPRWKAVSMDWPSPVASPQSTPSS